jgi:hypothetical protein
MCVVEEETVPRRGQTKFLYRWMRGVSTEFQRLRRAKQPTRTFPQARASSATH